MTIHPLSSEAFSVYGDVIEVNDERHHFTINYGHTERYHNLAEINTNANDGKTSVNIFRSRPPTPPIMIEIMERHPLSSQAFIPLSANPYLVVVAPQGDFDESKIKIFKAMPGQGVNYHAGTWHHYSLALENISDFLVIDRLGEGENCDEVKLKKPLSINTVI